MSEPNELEREVARRLDALERFGFPRGPMHQFVNEHPEGGMARLDWLEDRRETASEIEERIVALSEASSHDLEPLEAFREALFDPFEIEDVHRTFERTMRTLASWEPPLNRVRSFWYEEGLGETWNLLFDRLAALDASSGPAVEPFHRLFSEPHRYDETFRHLETVEEDERRQRAVIEEGVTQLRQRGMDVGDLSSLALLDALGALEEWQAFHDERERLRLSIAQLIEPFDADLALEFTKRCTGVLRPARRQDLEELRDEIGGLAQTFEERRKTLSQRISSWRSEGIVFPHEGELRPGDLLEWETNHDMVEASVKQHLETVERWQRFAKFWPSRTAASAHLVGHLDKTEALEEAVESLDNLWKKVELDALDVLQGYENAGLDVEGWRRLVFEDPLNALERLTATRNTWERRATLLRRMGNIDVSFSGREDVDVRSQLLASEELPAEVLEEIEGFADQLERRHKRHRSMLEEELAAVRRTGGIGEERNTERMNLLEFERYVSALQRHHPRSAQGTDSGPTPSMINALKEELDRLNHQGWLVGRWFELVSESPMEVARSLSQARPYIAHHDVLRRRILRLPWANDVGLAAEAELMLKQPDQLQEMSKCIPAWAAHLAQRTVEDETFTFTAWQPNQPHPTLLPVTDGQHPVLRPMSSLDDAHEAMLEAMEPEEQRLDDGLTEVEEVVDVAFAKEETVKPEVEPVRSVEPTTVPQPEEAVLVSAPPSSSSEDDLVSLAETEDDETSPEAEISVEATQALNTVESEATKAESEGTKEALQHLAQFLATLNLNGLADEVTTAGMGALPAVRRGLAQHVNVEPRDVRIARLLRLALRLLPENDDGDGQRAELLSRLTEMVAPLKRWIRRRLEARHSGAKGDFLADAAELGRALERIPGLGKHVPLEHDAWPLSNDLRELSHEVQRLRDVVFLPSAGGVQA